MAVERRLTLIRCWSRQDDGEKFFDFSHIVVNFINTFPDVLNLKHTQSADVSTGQKIFTKVITLKYKKEVKIVQPSTSVH